MKTEKISSESKTLSACPTNFDTPDSTRPANFDTPDSARPTNFDTPDSARPTNFDTPDSARPTNFDTPDSTRPANCETSGAEGIRSEQRNPAKGARSDQPGIERGRSERRNPAGGQSERGRPECEQPECARPEGGWPERRWAAAFVSPANVLTSMRIALSGVMLLMEPLSAGFFCVYGLAGFTDMIDGRIARKTGTDSGFGAMLDSAADLIFVASAFVCLFPVYKEVVPPWLWMAVAFVVYLKLKNAIAGFVINRKIVTMHTLLNRLTGVALFLLPFACLWVPLPVYGGFCAGMAVAATVDGFVRLLRGSTKFDNRM